MPSTFSCFCDGVCVTDRERPVELIDLRGGDTMEDVLLLRRLWRLEY